MKPLLKIYKLSELMDSNVKRPKLKDEDEDLGQKEKVLKQSVKTEQDISGPVIIIIIVFSEPSFVGEMIENTGIAALYIELCTILI